jgi:hypothetical protein
VVNGVTGGLIGPAAIEHRIKRVPVARRPGVAANSDGGSSRGSCRGNRLIVRCGRSWWFPGNKVKGRVCGVAALAFRVSDRPAPPVLARGASHLRNCFYGDALSVVFLIVMSEWLTLPFDFVVRAEIVASL